MASIDRCAATARPAPADDQPAIANAADGDRIRRAGRLRRYHRTAPSNSPGDEAAQISWLRLHAANRGCEVIDACASATVIAAGETPFEALAASPPATRPRRTGSSGFSGADPFGGTTFTGAASAPPPLPVRARSRVVLNAFTGFQLRGIGHTVEYNRASGNDRGFAVAGEAMTLRHNVAMANEDGILVSAGAAWLESNAVIGNRTAGIALLRGQDHHVRHSAVLGNPGGGAKDTFCPGRRANQRRSTQRHFRHVGRACSAVPLPERSIIKRQESRPGGSRHAQLLGSAAGPGPDPGDTVATRAAPRERAIQIYASELTLDVTPQH
jgi:hypothetical protein